MNINWKARIKNKLFWISIIPLILTLVHQVLRVFGIDLDLSDTANQLVDICETVFSILGLIGIINDPTTKGLSDSQLAMTYEEPKEDIY